MKNNSQLLEQNLLNQLKEAAENLGHSPSKREIINLAMRCHDKFGSFNKAKLKAGLGIVNVRQIVFPKNAFEKDKEMAAIASYLMCDGHLYKTLKGFMYSSKNISDLQEFEKIIKRKFDLPARYHFSSGGAGINKTHKIYFFNKIVSQELFKLGIPKREKVTQIYNVPQWISSSKELSREYLKIAYLCEGSIKDGNRKNPRITFVNAKWEDILESGVTFMNTLKEMLKYFDIESMPCSVRKNRRVRKKDGLITRDMAFRIKTSDNHKFIREIRWLK